MAENKKIQKEQRVDHPTSSLNPLVRVGGDQLQPGVEDGGTPTEVVGEKNKKILKRRKQKITKKEHLEQCIQSQHLIHRIQWKE